MTLENIFTPAAQAIGANVVYSGYGDVSYMDPNADSYLWWYMAPYKAEVEQAANEIANYAAMLQMVLQQIPTSKSVVALTIEPIFEVNCTTCHSKTKLATEHYNTQIRSFALNHSNLKIVDFSDFTRQFGREKLIDWKYYFISQMPLNPRLAGDFAHWFCDQYKAILGQRKKCLVLDLDNTLWGGVVGEDGVHGIKVGAGYPGNAYQYFQRYILQLQREGVIIALCSKNNLSDVEQVWSENKNNLIGKKHIAACRINWQDKATNLVEIAAELNIGLDSLVFVDDNPTERELVKGMLPQVAVPDFVAHPYDLPKLIQSIAADYFQIYSLTNEDLAKTEQYKANTERAKTQSAFVDFNDYVRSLEIELVVEPICAATLERAAQMTQKTNQFNLTTKRYSESDIQALLDQGAMGWTLSVKDKFGDNGITGLLIAVIHQKRAYVDTLLLSCRVLGKGIEKAFVGQCMTYLAQQGVAECVGAYVETAKNGQVADFYLKCGFEQLESNKYCLPLLGFTCDNNQIYKIL